MAWRRVSMRAGTGFVAWPSWCHTGAERLPRRGARAKPVKGHHTRAGYALALLETDGVFARTAAVGDASVCRNPWCVGGPNRLSHERTRAASHARSSVGCENCFDIGLAAIVAWQKPLVAIYCCVARRLNRPRVPASGLVLGWTGVGVDWCWGGMMLGPK